VISVATSTFNDRWLDAVLSIELQEPAGLRPIGTGFIVLTARNLLFLVTARHVVLDTSGAARSNLMYRRSDLLGPMAIVADATLRDQGAGSWHLSADFDLAGRFVGWPEPNPLAIEQRLF